MPSNVEIGPILVGRHLTGANSLKAKMRGFVYGFAQLIPKNSSLSRCLGKVLYNGKPRIKKQNARIKKRRKMQWHSFLKNFSVCECRWKI